MKDELTLCKAAGKGLWQWAATALLAIVMAGGAMIINHGVRLAVVESCIKDIRDDVREIKAWVVPQPPG